MSDFQDIATKALALLDEGRPVVLDEGRSTENSQHLTVNLSQIKDPALKKKVHDVREELKKASKNAIQTIGQIIANSKRQNVEDILNSILSTREQLITRLEGWHSLQVTLFERGKLSLAQLNGRIGKRVDEEGLRDSYESVVLGVILEKMIKEGELKVSEDEVSEIKQRSKRLIVTWKGE